MLPNFFPAHQDTPQFLAGCDGAQAGANPKPAITIRPSQFLACRRPSQSLRRHSQRPGPPYNPEIAGILAMLAPAFVAWLILMRSVLRTRCTSVLLYELRHCDESMASLDSTSYIPRGGQIPPAAGGATKSGDNKLVVG